MVLKSWGSFAKAVASAAVTSPRDIGSHRHPRLPPRRTALLPNHSILELRDVEVLLYVEFFPSRAGDPLASLFAIGRPSCRVSMPPQPPPTVAVPAQVH